MRHSTTIRLCFVPAHCDCDRKIVWYPGVDVESGHRHHCKYPRSSWWYHPTGHRYGSPNNRHGSVWQSLPTWQGRQSPPRQFVTQCLAEKWGASCRWYQSLFSFLVHRRLRIARIVGLGEIFFFSSSSSSSLSLKVSA